MSLTLIFVILAITTGSLAQSSAPDQFPRGRHSLGDSCDPVAWENFNKDRDLLLDLVVKADPTIVSDELNQLLSEGQERIIRKNYTNICNFHQYLECNSNRKCVCVDEAPPFNFILSDGECRGKRGALCDSDGDIEGYFACLPGYTCELALAGNTAICGGKQGFDEEIKKYRRENNGSIIPCIPFAIAIAIACLITVF